MPDEAAVPPDRAVVDRIVDGVTAVLLVGPDQRELLLPVADLPEAAGEGTWLIIDRAADPPRIVSVDEQRTDARGQQAAQRLSQIRRERSTGRFSRD